MKKYIFLAVLFYCLGSLIIVNAIPAKPGMRIFCQPDGTMLTVNLRGDEFFHFYETEDGILLKADQNNALWYAVLDDKGNIVPGKYLAADASQRSAEVNKYLDDIGQGEIKKELFKTREEKISTRANMPGQINSTFPTTGNVRGIVILAEYQDIKFCEQYETLEVYKDLINAENYGGEYSTGSVRDFYVDQSSGVFIPEFDVIGPVTLPQNRSFYGSTNNGSENVPQMIIDACLLADQEWGVDFSQYDMDNDGFVDFIYVIYAGHGEAQGGPPECVWPQSWTLEYIYFKKLDGKYLGKYACSCELSGGAGTVLDGIGTFCHEYGHILGLPDIYDTAYSGYFGMGHWDTMDVGAYNNNSRTPPAFSAMERYSLGWMEPNLLDEPGSRGLESLEISNTAFFMVSDHDENEYFVFENRQPVKWDMHLPAHGMLISQVHYDRTIWSQNRVNTAAGGYEHVKLIAADNAKTYDDEAGDVFPGTSNNTSFTDTSTPSSLWNNGSKVNRPVFHIKVGAGGVIIFDYIQATGIESVKSDEALVEITVTNRVLQIQNSGLQRISLFSVNGQQITPVRNDELIEFVLNPGIYIVNVEGGDAIKVCVE